jgi:hypothetical protein
MSLVANGSHEPEPSDVEDFSAFDFAAQPAEEFQFAGDFPVPSLEDSVPGGDSDDELVFEEVTEIPADAPPRRQVAEDGQPLEIVLETAKHRRNGAPDLKRGVSSNGACVVAARRTIVNG